MTLQKINDILNKTMIGAFVSIIVLTLVAMLIPFFGYVVGVLLYALGIITLANLAISTYLMVQYINKMMEEFFRNYERSIKEQH